jgi:hypothetical protein
LAGVPRLGEIPQPDGGVVDHDKDAVSRITTKVVPSVLTVLTQIQQARTAGASSRTTPHA